MAWSPAIGTAYVEMCWITCRVKSGHVIGSGLSIRTKKTKLKWLAQGGAWGVHGQNRERCMTAQLYHSDLRFARGFHRYAQESTLVKSVVCFLSSKEYYSPIKGQQQEQGKGGKKRKKEGKTEWKRRGCWQEEEKKDQSNRNPVLLQFLFYLSSGLCKSFYLFRSTKL